MFTIELSPWPRPYRTHRERILLAADETGNPTLASAPARRWQLLQQAEILTGGDW